MGGDYPLHVVVVKQKRRKTATGQIRGREAVVTIPAHWPKSYATAVQVQLSQQLVAQFQNDVQLVAQAQGEWVTLLDPETLAQWVYALNRQTFEGPLQKVRLGSAKYSRLAQMNTRTQVMTVSRFCVDRVPEGALRYLVIHELAHLLEANHSRAFWAHVAQFDPQFRYHRKLIQAVHRVRLYEASPTAALVAPVPAPRPSLWEQLTLPFMGG